MSKLEKLLGIREALRSYAAGDKPAEKEDAKAENVSDEEEFTPEQEHEDEAAGLELAARHLAAQYGNDPTNPDFLDHLDALRYGNYGPLEKPEDEERSYAAKKPALPASKPGYVLRASKTNPRVRRWVKVTALRNVGVQAQTAAAKAAGVGAGIAVGHLGGGARGAHTGATAAGLAVMSLHHSVRRQHGLKDESHSALTAKHYLEHHNDFLELMAKRHKVRKEAVAHALAYHAHAEHHRQNAEVLAGKKMKNGHPFPVANKNLTDKQYHKNLSGRAKRAFREGVGHLTE